MKRYLYSGYVLAGLMLVFLLTLLPARSVSAAVERPESVATLKAKETGETTARLYWSQVSDADGYIVCRVNSARTVVREVARVPKTTRYYNVPGLQPTVSSYFQVYSYKAKGKKIYKSEEGSPVVTVETAVKEPAKVKNLRRICYGNKSVFLAWDKVNDASWYYLYIYNEDKERYEKAAKTTENTYQLKGLKVDEISEIIVRSCRSVKGHEQLSEPSDVVRAKGKKIDVAAVHGRFWSAYLKTTITTKDLSTGKNVTLKAGTGLWTPACNGGLLTAVRPNGTKIQVRGSNLRFGNLHVTESINTYSKAQREAFINGRGYSSNTRYLIWINQYSSCLSVFEGSKGQWRQVLATDCVVGNLGHTTPGVFKLIKYGTKLGKPMIFFTWNSTNENGLAIHCRLDGNKRGPVSGGCIRLGDRELFFVYNNCKLGTTVVSY